MRRLLHARRLLAIYFMALLCALIVWQAPARLADHALRSLTDERIRLLETQGSIWAGGGILSERVNQSYHPWAKLRWEFDARRLFAALLSVRVALDEQPELQLQAGISGFRLDAPRLALPAGPLVRAIPHPAGRLGWNGQLTVNGTLRHCNWHGVCDGELLVTLSNTTVSALPDPALGDYSAYLKFAAPGIELLLDSAEHNRLKAQGTARLSPGREFHGEVRLGGDPLFLEQIASMTADVSHWRAGALVMAW